MDTKLEKKSSKPKIILIILLVMVLVGTFAYYFINQKNSVNVSLEDLRITTVKESNFEDMMMVTGQTESLNTSLINVPEGGAIQEILAENGDMVQQGQPLARIYNASTEFNYMNQETNIMQQIGQMQGSLLEIKNQAFSQQQELLQAQNDLKSAEQQFNLQKRLFDAEIGRKTDFEEASQRYNYQQQRINLVEQGVSNDQKARQQQMRAIQQSIAQLEKSLNALRSNKNNFLIQAPASGRLSSFDISLGQNLQSGESIGKIDLMNGYKLIAKVDEFYINRLQVGIPGTMEINQKTYEVLITKVSPEVSQGQFEIELKFADEKPKNLRMGMNFAIKLKLSQDTKSLVIPKGNFYKDTSGQWIYVVKDNMATKRKIEIGRENSLNYEIVSGLEPNEKVIISGYEDYKQYEKLNIQSN
ncbi:HlyD family efflux transporter periplasmic adaptor subunit [Flavobacteriaceae bacterium Ap0902]|nr:HlyD family efflux transporter periplasmic adaptor subunit [Flavobacteriaceae bacterium Ap0902]